MASGESLLRARDKVGCGGQEWLASLAMDESKAAAVESARHEQLAKRITPEIEAAISCLYEAVALGLVDLGAASREAELRRRHSQLDR